MRGYGYETPGSPLPPPVFLPLRHTAVGLRLAGLRAVEDAPDVIIIPGSFSYQLDAQADNVSQAAALMHASASYLRRAGPVIRAARRCVLNPAWAGVCDEDVALEKALRDGGWL